MRDARTHSLGDHAHRPCNRTGSMAQTLSRCVTCGCSRDDHFDSGCSSKDRPRCKCRAYKGPKPRTPAVTFQVYTHLGATEGREGADTLGKLLSGTNRGDKWLKAHLEPPHSDKRKSPIGSGLFQMAPDVGLEPTTR